jgi:hypothetical protein
MTPLREHLLDAYGGFADRRFKDRDLDRAIKIDDRDATDGYPDFCSIFVAVPDRLGDALRLTLQLSPSTPRSATHGRSSDSSATSTPPATGRLARWSGNQRVSAVMIHPSPGVWHASRLIRPRRTAVLRPPIAYTRSSSPRPRIGDVSYSSDDSGVYQPRRGEQPPGSSGRHTGTSETPGHEVPPTFGVSD